MSQRKSLIVLVAFGLLACLDSTADARGFRVGLVPNGAENNCATCHNNPGGGGPRNSFGGDVGELVGRGSRDPFWSLDLAIQDSDSDGFTNGEELGDPDGDGVANRTVNISNPGLADDSPVAAVGDCNLDTTLNADDLSCISDIPARDAVLEALNTLPGDLDGNGQVEFGDFLVLSANFGTDSPAYTDGNIDLRRRSGLRRLSDSVRQLRTSCGRGFGLSSRAVRRVARVHRVDDRTYTTKENSRSNGTRAQRLIR